VSSELELDVAAGVVMRPVRESDAAELAAAYVRNRDHLRPWEPDRPPAFFTPEGQRTVLRERLAAHREGRVMPWVLTDGSAVLGVVTLANIVPGAFRSANVGYWVDAAHTGRGLASRAVGRACEVADSVLRLHRLEAGTLLHNAASQRVLTRCGFTPIGVAPAYLHINGAWRDHRLFQRILNDRRPGA
jgi:ribosomal-protein-alanine N-acetyltransferase